MDSAVKIFRVKNFERIMQALTFAYEKSNDKKL